MKKYLCPIDGFARCVWFAALSTLLGTGAAHAGFSLGGADNYAVLYEGTGGHNLSFNNGTISGNIGLGDPSGTSHNPQLQLSGGSANTILNGNVQFAGAVNNSGTAGTDYTITPGNTISGGNANVTTALNTINSLYSTLSAEAGTALTVNLNNNQSQTINASSGILDGSGNRVFSVSSFNFGNGATLTINGSASDYIVINFSGGAQFGGTIQLTGGITSDQVLFDVDGTLQISSNGATETGTFLDPDGNIQENHSVLDGRLFGGDSQDMSIVSGGSVYAPASSAVPEPSTIFAGVLLLFPLGAGAVRALVKDRAVSRKN